MKAGSSLKVGLVPFANAGGSGAQYRIWLPYEQPRPDRNLLADGVEIRSRKPNAGSIIDGNFDTIAITFNNHRATQDFFGVELEDPITIGSVMFAHGKTFHDGGWFDATGGKPHLEIKTTASGSWTALADITDYPDTTATNSAGLKAGEKFTYQLPKPMDIYGVRVVGRPASGDNPKQAFASCAELEAFAPQH